MWGKETVVWGVENVIGGQEKRQNMVCTFEPHQRWAGVYIYICMCGRLLRPEKGPGPPQSWSYRQF